MDKSKLINWILLILGAIFMAYGVGISFIVNGIAKAIMIMGAVLIALSLFKSLGKRHLIIKHFNRIDKVINVLVILSFISVFIIEGAIVYGSFEKNKGKTDYILVLGAGLWGDAPSDTLIRRLEGAVELSEINKDSIILVSGGQGPGETVTEAEAMEKYLMAKGVDKKRIVREEKATNTMGNMNFSKEIMDELWRGKEEYNVTIITSNFHIFRSKLLAKRAGMNVQAYSVAVKKPIEPAYYIREYFALIKSYIFDR